MWSKVSWLRKLKNWITQLLITIKWALSQGYCCVQENSVLKSMHCSANTEAMVQIPLKSEKLFSGYFAIEDVAA